MRDPTALTLAAMKRRNVSIGFLWFDTRESQAGEDATENAQRVLLAKGVCNTNYTLPSDLPGFL